MNRFKKMLPVPFLLFIVSVVSCEASFEMLPRDIKIRVLAATEPTSENFCKYELVSKSFRDAATDNRLWKMAMQPYFKFNLGLYTKYSMTALIISKQQYKKNATAEQYAHYPQCKLMVKFRMKIAKEISAKCFMFLNDANARIEKELKTITVTGYDEIPDWPFDSANKFRSILVATELAGCKAPISQHLNSLNKKRENSYTRTLIEYINLGSKVADEKLKSYNTKK